jgi:hypothetical protein
VAIALSVWKLTREDMANCRSAHGPAITPTSNVLLIPLNQLHSSNFFGPNAETCQLTD